MSGGLVEPLLEALFSRRNADGASLERLVQRIEQLIDALAAHEQARDRGSELSVVRALAAIEPSALRQLELRARDHSASMAGALASEIEQARASVRAELDKPADDRNLQPCLIAFAALGERVAGMRGALGKAPSALRLWIAPLYSLPVVGAYLLGVFLQLGPSGLELEHTELAVQQGPGCMLIGLQALDKVERAAALQACAKSYFTALPEEPGAADNTPPMLSQVARNQAHTDALFVPSLRVRASFAAKPFPWRELPTEPELKARWSWGKVFGASHFGGAAISLPAVTNEGHGPAIDVLCELSSARSGLPLWEAKSQTLFLLGQTLAAPIDEELQLPEGVEARSQEGGRLTAPVYIADAPEPHEGPAVLCDGRSFWPSSNVEALCRTTQCARNEAIELSCGYGALAAPARAERKFTHDLDPSVVLFRVSEAVHSDGLCGYEGRDGGGFGAGRGWIRTGRALLDPQAHDAKPEGEPLIFEALALDVAELANGRSLETRKSVHRLLRGEGILAYDLELTGLRNGSYEIEVFVGPDRLSSQKLEVLAPDEASVEHIEPEELFQRFGREDLARRAALRGVIERAEPAETEPEPSAVAEPELDVASPNAPAEQPAPAEEPAPAEARAMPVGEAALPAEEPAMPAEEVATPAEPIAMPAKEAAMPEPDVGRRAKEATTAGAKQSAANRR